MSTRIAHDFDALVPEAVLFGARVTRTGWYRPNKYVYYVKETKQFFIHDPKRKKDKPWTDLNNDCLQYDWEVIGYENEE